MRFHLSNTLNYKYSTRASALQRLGSTRLAAIEPLPYSPRIVWRQQPYCSRHTPPIVLLVRHIPHPYLIAVFRNQEGEARARARAFKQLLVFSCANFCVSVLLASIEVDLALFVRRRCRLACLAPALSGGVFVHAQLAGTCARSSVTCCINLVRFSS